MELSAAEPKKQLANDVARESALDRLEKQKRILSLYMAGSGHEKDRIKEVHAIVASIKKELTNGDAERRGKISDYLKQLDRIEKLAMNPLDAWESAPVPSQAHLFSKVIVFRVPAGQSVRLFDNVRSAGGYDGSLSGVDIPATGGEKTINAVSYAVTQRASGEPGFKEYVIGLRKSVAGCPVKDGTLRVEVNGKVQEFSYCGHSPAKILQVSADELAREAATVAPAPMQPLEDLVVPPPPGKLNMVPKVLPVEDVRDFLKSNCGSAERIYFADGSGCECWKVKSPGKNIGENGTLIRLYWLEGREKQPDSWELQWATAEPQFLADRFLKADAVADLHWQPLQNLQLQDDELIGSDNNKSRPERLSCNAFSIYHNTLARRLLRLIEQKEGGPGLDQLKRAQDGLDEFLNGDGRELGDAGNYDELNLFLALDAALTETDMPNSVVSSRELISNIGVVWRICDPTADDTTKPVMSVGMLRTPDLSSARLNIGIGTDLTSFPIEFFTDTDEMDLQVRRRIDALMKAREKLVKTWGADRFEPQ